MVFRGAYHHNRRGAGEGGIMDDARREFVSCDGIRWQYTIEHQTQENGVAWRAHVWEKDVCRGVLEGRVWTTEPGDPDAICNVAVKMALDANYLRDFAQDADETPAASAAPANDPDAADGLPGPDPMPSPA
ncbi:MAG TPA: hypothetical protein VGT79_08160 [Xanthomonadaceae bacterium]|nr:hypothetical protein [Xanthomonadaceae bacterium]